MAEKKSAQEGGLLQRQTFWLAAVERDPAALEGLRPPGAPVQPRMKESKFLNHLNECYSPCVIDLTLYLFIVLLLLSVAALE